MLLCYLLPRDYGFNMLPLGPLQCSAVHSGSARGPRAETPTFGRSLIPFLICFIFFSQIWIGCHLIFNFEIEVCMKQKNCRVRRFLTKSVNITKFMQPQKIDSKGTKCFILHLTSETFNNRQATSDQGLLAHRI